MLGELNGDEELMRGETLAQQVYRRLSNAISAGSFAPNERISMRRLADGIGASVTPVREAILRLVADGVLETTEQNAIIVPERTEAEVDEIFDIRRVIEGDMALAAAPRLGRAELATLKNIQAEFLLALQNRDYPQVLRHNSMFHFFIYRRSDLPLRLKIAETLWLRIGPTLRYMYPLLDDRRMSNRRHDDILDAVAQRDPDKLRTTILADINAGQDALHQYIKKQAEIALERKNRRRRARPG